MVHICLAEVCGLLYFLALFFNSISVNLLGCAWCRGGDNVTAVRRRERRLGRCLDRRNSGGRATEEPTSRDDWETIVRYNEKILEQQNMTPTTADRLQRVTKVSPHHNVMTRLQLNPSSQRVQRPNFKPPKPPKPTSPQQTSKPLLPVQQFLNRQVGLQLCYLIIRLYNRVHYSSILMLILCYRPWRR